MRRAFVHFLWGALITIVSFLFVFFIAVWNGWIGYMPDMEELSNPLDKFASQVYSADGKLIGTWNQENANRVAVDYNNLSPHLVHALVATEDERFYEHSGIDFIALFRAVVKRGILGRKEAGGGSTITQQLAKQLYTSSNASSSTQRIMQKAIEWVIAVQLERHYSKDEILTLYLNYFDFLHHAVGIKTASRVYFNKEPGDLTVPEAAMLIGMCKNPSYYNPVRDSVRVINRRNVVLSLMEEQGFLTKTECGKYKNASLGLNLQRVSHRDGLATYFREYLRHIMMAKAPVRENYASWQRQEFVDDSIAWLTDPLYGWCNKNYKKDGSPYNIYTDGLRIHTTINSRMQRYAERAVREHIEGYLQPLFEKEKHVGKYLNPFSKLLSKDQIREILRRAIERSERYRAMRAAGMSDEEVKRFFKTEKVPMTIYTSHGEVETMMTPQDSILYYKTFLRTGFMSMDPLTGSVKAYVGGLDYSYFKYDMVMLGRRQVGSTIKPFLYALAMQNGMTPCTLAPNVQRSYGGWTPRNGSHARYGQMVPLKWGLMMSNNWISAYLINQLGPSQFVSILHDFGLNNPDIDKNTTPVLSLGPCEVSVGEMVSGYTAFVNQGIRCAPLFVTKIEDSHGNVIAQFQPLMNEVISEDNSYKMIDMLRAVVDNGTGNRLRYQYNITGEVGGKTGTTNNNSDGWFIGFTPQLVSGVWVGGEDRDIHFDSTSMGQGATMALPIWAYFMKLVYADKTLGYSPGVKFNVPSSFNPCAVKDTVNMNGIDEVYE